MDIRNEIAHRVHLIDQLKEQKEDLWTKARNRVADNHIEDAIILLNRYFGVRRQLEGMEAGLAWSANQ